MNQFYGAGTNQINEDNQKLLRFNELQGQRVAKFRRDELVKYMSYDTKKALRID